MAYCLPCFVFEKNPASRSALITDGFNNWKRVNDGKNCAFLLHVGGPSSPHNNYIRCAEDLMKSSQHIEKVIQKQPKEQILKNRLRLKATIESVRWLTFQACALRGNDESIDSMNRGNFVELIKYTAQWNDKVNEVVLDNAPGNAKYISGLIQKEILHILADKVRTKIREEVGESHYCILVDEAKDASNREQMAIVLRFVDKDGFVRERFFEIVRVEDTSSLTLKQEISRVLINSNLQIDKMRGQGYDGASNMRGAWNGLQALFLRDCPYAYYVHCFAHRLQLALVAASKDVASIWLFFSTLNSIINLITASPKRHGQLQSTQKMDIANMLGTGERATGKGANQIGTLHRPGATRWGSHYDSCSDLIDMYNASCTVVETLIKDGASNSIRGEAT
ncbi:zinc finger MYM-type protein 1-like, partial [Prunus avium]|uniref:Zinc finger MYM-type protein 1-like n=1 Tax=Prunus avium TaxID=42229 RepID=A0A6P5RQ99_PRUAV